MRRVWNSISMFYNNYSALTIHTDCIVFIAFDCRSLVLISFLWSILITSSLLMQFDCALRVCVSVVLIRLAVCALVSCLCICIVHNKPIIEVSLQSDSVRYKCTASIIQLECIVPTWSAEEDVHGKCMYKLRRIFRMLFSIYTESGAVCLSIK